MRIRPGFVSNSSSTSFLVIANEPLTEEAFFRLMGLAAESPLSPIFRELYEELMAKAEIIELRDLAPGVPVSAVVSGRGITERMLQKAEEARASGATVYVGTLSSDGGYAEQFFCTESFEAEQSGLYINALECAW